MAANTNFLTALGWALMHSLWQMAFLWLISQFIFLLFKRTSSSFKSLFATTLLIVGMVSFIVTFFLQLSYLHKDEETIFFTNSNISESYFETLTPIISIIYLFLLLFTCSRFIKNYRYVQVIKKYGLSKTSYEWRNYVQKISPLLGIKRKVKVWLSEFVSSPVTIGWIKPIILLPVAALNNLTPQQVETLLLHELAHIKRYDFLLNLIVNLIRTLLFFNPFVIALVKITEAERENSCDELVLQFQYPAIDYATALVAMQQQCAKQKVFALPATGRFHLHNRIETIMGVRQEKRFTVRHFFSIGFASLLIILSFYFERGSYSSKAIGTLMPAQKIQPTNFQIAELTGFFEERQNPKNNIVKRDLPHTVQITRATDFPIHYSTINDVTEKTITPFISTSYQTVEITPTLKDFQQKQVKQAIASSKKVIEDLQWKAIEKSLAEVFTQIEKDELKKKYDKELQKINWKNWEQKLTVAYNKIDWDKVNTQLNNAVNTVRIDSIQQVYNVALAKLNKAHKILIETDLNYLPDSDISAELINQKRKEALEVLKKIRDTKRKKIVHL